MVDTFLASKWVFSWIGDTQLVRNILCKFLSAFRTIFLHAVRANHVKAFRRYMQELWAFGTLLDIVMFRDLRIKILCRIFTRDRWVNRSLELMEAWFLLTFIAFCYISKGRNKQDFITKMTKSKVMSKLCWFKQSLKSFHLFKVFIKMRG